MIGLCIHNIELQKNPAIGEEISKLNELKYILIEYQLRVYVIRKTSKRCKPRGCSRSP